MSSAQPNPDSPVRRRRDDLRRLWWVALGKGAGRLAADGQAEQLFLSWAGLGLRSARRRRRGRSSLPTSAVTDGGRSMAKAWGTGLIG